MSLSAQERLRLAILWHQLTADTPASTDTYPISWNNPERRTHPAALGLDLTEEQVRKQFFPHKPVELTKSLLEQENIAIDEYPGETTDLLDALVSIYINGYMGKTIIGKDDLTNLRPVTKIGPRTRLKQLFMLHQVQWRKSAPKINSAIPSVLTKKSYKSKFSFFRNRTVEERKVRFINRS